ncbi:MAG: hypothetical protein OFPI_41900 [Osedax symbiont Rs2]|nr:MAG: hypothetical protein OFPI_41900 [Osedax symbiont Rs2]
MVNILASCLVIGQQLILIINYRIETNMLWVFFWLFRMLLSVPGRTNRKLSFALAAAGRGKYAVKGRG